MRRAYEPGKPVIRINVDCDHKIEAQQRQVSEVVLGQAFAPEMCVNATQTAKAINCDANAFEIGKFDASIVADHHIFNMAAAIDKRADLPPCFVGQFGELSREFRRQNLVGSDPPRVELFYAAKLIRLEARGVSNYVLDSSFPPSTMPFNGRKASESADRPASGCCLELKLQDE